MKNISRYTKNSSFLVCKKKTHLHTLTLKHMKRAIYIPLVSQHNNNNNALPRC